MKRVGILSSSFKSGRSLFAETKQGILEAILKGISFNSYALHPPRSPIRGRLYGNGSLISNVKATYLLYSMFKIRVDSIISDPDL